MLRNLAYSKHVINVTNSYFYQSKSRRLSTCIRWQRKWHSKVKEYLLKPAEKEYDTVKAFFFHFFLIFMGIQLIYSVLLVLGIQQSASVIHIPTFFFRFFFHMGPYRILSKAPQAIQQVLISYLFYIQQYIYVNLNLPVYPSYSLVTINLFSTSVTLLLFGKYK